MKKFLEFICFIFGHNWEKIPEGIYVCTRCNKEWEENGTKNF